MRCAGWFCIVVSVAWVGQVIADDPAPPDYAAHVAPILKKYCVGCHNPSEKEGELSLESFADMQQGGGRGPALLSGQADSSRIIRVLTGAAEPRMPPEGEPAPSPDQVALLKAWIDAGAKGPQGAEPDRMTLITPAVDSRTDTRPVTALDISPDGELLAVAQYQKVTLQPVAADSPSGVATEALHVIGGFPGKVTALHFTPDGKQLVTASGVTGLGGEAAIWNVADGSLVKKFQGHRDALFDAELSPDGATLATCSYDRDILLWDVASGRQLRTLVGHNGAVYDVAFSPDGEFLVSGSADDTCKVWRVVDGERMDTLGQPLKEVYSVGFSPDGKSIVAAGADNRIRVWRFISRDVPRVNPQRIARFAHEGAVLKLAFTPDGKYLASIAEDRALKVWETRNFTAVHVQQEPSVADALSVAGQQPIVAVGRLDGSLAAYRLPADALRPNAAMPVARAPDVVDIDPEKAEVVEESEPNNAPPSANPLDAPVQVTGTIEGRYGQEADSDLYKFAAKAGEEWVIEIIAARSKSPLDSYVEVLNEGGRPVERVLLQAVRDSYFTFRGKNADEVGDFRVFNWEEMDLNEYLHANGEVVKLWMAPRGPDSGFNVYPGEGKRWGYFDTTPLAHALGEPCYVVRPHPPGSALIPNGLPVFTLYYENDDESYRKFGNDSKLSFTAPQDGNYLVRIRDVRGFEGEDYRYRLFIRPRRPDFRVSIDGDGLKVSPGSQVEFRVTADRLDGYEGPITVELSGLPPGIEATSPIVIQEGQLDAFGVLSAAADAPATTPQNQMISLSKGTAVIRDTEVSHPGDGFGKIELGEQPKLTAKIVPADKGAVPVAMPPDGPLEFVIQPGETIMLKVQIERTPFKGEVSWGKEEAGRNLPHGVIVDNIGLNGLLLLEDQTERDFFITAAPWVPDQSRLFHLSTSDGGGAATQPVMLHVRREDPATPRTAGP